MNSFASGSDLCDTNVCEVDKDIIYSEAAVSLGKQPVIYVTKGEELRLQCNTSKSRQDVMQPPEVEWFKVWRDFIYGFRRFEH